MGQGSCRLVGHDPTTTVPALLATSNPPVAERLGVRGVEMAAAALRASDTAVGYRGRMCRILSALSTTAPLQFRETDATEEMLAVPFIEFVHPNDREAAMLAVQQLTEGRDVVTCRARAP